MRPDQLLGMGYRLGADPEKHGATDCLGLCRAVAKFYGIESPTPPRDWYRRLRRGDWAVFPEQLDAWGVRIPSPKMEGTVALCRAGDGYGLAMWWQDGWLMYRDNRVAWCPTEALPAVAFYCPQKQTSAMP